MRLYIKNMVCSRCRMVVQAELEMAGLHPLTVEQGEVEIGVSPTKEQLTSGELGSANLSDHLAEKLHYEYTYLSNLFSAVEGTTIEKYFIAQKVEKVKELLGKVEGVRDVRIDLKKGEAEVDMTRHVGTAILRSAHMYMHLWSWGWVWRLRREWRLFGLTWSRWW